MQLFNLDEFYNLKTIEETTRVFIRKKFPKPISEDEDIDEYNSFLDDEYKLELADRLKNMARQLELEVENKVKKNGY